MINCFWTLWQLVYIISPVNLEDFDCCKVDVDCVSSFYNIEDSVRQHF